MPKRKLRQCASRHAASKEDRAVALEGLKADHEHSSDMGIYKYVGREVNRRGVWASVGHRERYLFYSSLGSWCVSDAADMAAGLNQGTLMVESDAEAPHTITEPWSAHDSENWSAGAPGVQVRCVSDAEAEAAVRSVKQATKRAAAAAQ